MKKNYCLVDKNKIYAEIYDELLDEELSMFNKEHSDKIKNYLEKKIINNPCISLSGFFESIDDIMSDIIIKITSGASNKNLQGNTVLMFAGPNEMYELFHMENLTVKIADEELNELGSISNIHLLPITWACGIFKTSYSSGVAKTSEITKKDLSEIFIQNYYHQGVMINEQGDMLQIEFTGEDPYKVIGTNFVQSNVTNVIGFSLLSWIESGNELNNKASIIFGKEIKGRMFITLLCPTTNKKFWNIDVKTVNNIIKICSDKKLYEEIEKNLEQTDKDINPFYILKQTLSNKDNK
jgi:hypothetical protein